MRSLGICSHELGRVLRHPARTNPDPGRHACAFALSFYFLSLLNLWQHGFYFMVRFGGLQAWGILAPRLGIEPASPALEGEFLIMEPPGKSPLKKSINCLIHFHSMSWARTSTESETTKHKKKKQKKQPSCEWEPAFTKSITQKWWNRCAYSAKVNNKLENISRDQENINCYMEDLKGGQPKETARKKKKKDWNEKS